jgi:hypothetical protein
MDEAIVNSSCAVTGAAANDPATAADATKARIRLFTFGPPHVRDPAP